MLVGSAQPAGGGADRALDAAPPQAAWRETDAPAPATDPAPIVPDVLSLAEVLPLPLPDAGSGL